MFDYAQSKPCEFWYNTTSDQQTLKPCIACIGYAQIEQCDFQGNLTSGWQTLTPYIMLRALKCDWLLLKLSVARLI